MTLGLQLKVVADNLCPWLLFWFLLLRLPSGFPHLQVRLNDGIIQERRCCCCSVTQSCLTICNPMDCSTSGFHVLHYLSEFAQTHIQWCHPTISSSVVPFSSWHQIFPASGSFLMSQFFTSGGQSIGFSFSICPSSEYSGLISFRID